MYPQEIAEHMTTLTYGEDVSRIIANLIGNPRAMNEIFNISSNCAYSWKDIIDFYSEILTEILGKRPNFIPIVNTKKYARIMGNEIATMYDRQFDNFKIVSVCPEVKFTRLEDGIRKCLMEFIKNTNWKAVRPKDEAYFDIISNDKTPIDLFSGLDKMRYIYFRYMPNLLTGLNDKVCGN